jgi:hypothetical protein
MTRIASVPISEIVIFSVVRDRNRDFDAVRLLANEMGYALEDGFCDGNHFPL